MAWSNFCIRVLLFAFFAILPMSQDVRAQGHPLWLQGDANDTDPDLERLNRALIRLAEKVRPAVVHVRAEPSQTRGSGFLINHQGYILTAHHVVDQAQEIEIRLWNRQRLAGEVIASDNQVDVAIVKLKEKREFPVLPLSDSDALRVGELVGSLGYPFGLESSLHVGTVSRRGKRQNNSVAFDHIQVDSPTTPGASGGPLVNMKGHVVGMLTQASVKGTMGFAVPINIIKEMIPRLLSGEKIAWGWLGIRLSELTMEMADGLRLSPLRGVLVGSVLANQPADRAGILSRDIILSVNEFPVDKPSEVLRFIQGTEAGTELRLRIFRNGETFVVPARLGNKPRTLGDHEG